MTELNDGMDMTSLDLGDDEDEEEMSLGLDSDTESSLLELGSDVFMLIDNEDDLYDDEEQLARISIDEMVKGMGLYNPEPLSLGYEFDEDDEEEEQGISGIDLTGLTDEVDLSAVDIVPGILLTDLKETDRNLPYSSVYWSQTYNHETKSLELKEPVTLQQAAKNYIGGNNDMASILAAQDRYKLLMTGALNGLVSGLYNSVVHDGVLTYLRNNTGIRRSQRSASGSGSSIDDVIKTFIEAVFVKESDTSAGKKYERKSFKAPNGTIFEPDDNAIATRVIDLLIDYEYLSSNIRANGERYADLRDKVLRQIDEIFYDKDMATKAGSVRLRDWFMDATSISYYLMYTLVYYPFIGNTEQVPLIKTERTPNGIEQDYSRDVGQSFKVVFRDDKGSTISVDASKVFDWGDTEYFRMVQNEPPRFTKEVAGITDYRYIDPNDELDFMLHKVFAMGSYKGLKGTGVNTKMVMKCDCGESYVEIAPNLQAVAYFLSNNSTYRVQLLYVPVVCPHCGRIMLVERELLDSITERITTVLRANSGENVKFIAGSQRNYGFKLIPPFMVSFSNNEHDEIMQIEEEKADDSDVVVMSKYESADLTRQIEEYEKQLNKFRARRNNNGALNKYNFAYLVCSLLLEDYDSLKLQSVNSILSMLVNEGIISTVDVKLKESLLSFWDKKDISFSEYEENLEIITRAANRTVAEDTQAITMDLLRESPDGEALRVSPVALLEGRTLEERWDFLRMVCMRFFPTEKIDVTGWEDQWLIRYEEIGELIRGMHTVEDLDLIIQMLNGSINQIACGEVTGLPVDYRLFNRFFRNENFLNFLDRASDMMILTGLCDKIVRYFLKTPKELSTFVFRDCNLSVLVAQMKKKVLDKATAAFMDNGTMTTKLDSQYFYRLFYAVDKSFASDMDRALDSSKRTVLRSYSKNKWEKDLEVFSTDVCSYEDVEDMVEVLQMWVSSFKSLSADEFYKMTVQLKELFLNGRQKLMNSTLYGKIYKIVDELCSRGALSGAEECLVHAKNFYNVEILTSPNEMLKVLGFKELASSAVLDMLFKYYDGYTFFEAYMLYALGISTDSVKCRTKSVRDYIQMEANEDFDFQVFLLNMLYPISDMNYVTELDEGEDNGSYSDDFLDRHAHELVNEHYTELLNILPSQYKEYVEKYLGEE